jgi:hypothetical protein
VGHVLLSFRYRLLRCGNDNQLDLVFQPSTLPSKPSDR